MDFEIQQNPVTFGMRFDRKSPHDARPKLELLRFAGIDRRLDIITVQVNNDMPVAGPIHLDGVALPDADRLKIIRKPSVLDPQFKAANVRAIRLCGQACQACQPES
jgi:hypothetical protein